MTKNPRCGTEAALVLPAVTVVSFLPISAHHDGCSHALGLRIVVPEALRRLAAPAIAAAATYVTVSSLTGLDIVIDAS